MPAVGAHTGALLFTPSSVLPERPSLPDDPVGPHNGFATWTWDQTMRATDSLLKVSIALAGAVC